MSANYLNTVSKKDSESLKHFKKSNRRGSFSLIAIFSILAIFVSGLITMNVASTQVTKAEAWDPVKDVLCGFDDETFPKLVYNFTQTNDFEFALFSKSPVTGGGMAIDAGLNTILEFSGADFKAANELVTGLPLDRTGNVADPNSEEVVPKTEEEIAASFNQGPLVSPYDRFGMAGTVFTAYNGEWRYLVVDACSDDSPTDLQLGKFYDDRLEPRSTWEDRDGSEDPRTQQHAYGWNSQFWKGFLNLSANMMLSVTKTITTFTIAFINLSFSDISNNLGLDEILMGDGTEGDTGIFQQLYEGLYIPLIVIIMSLTGVRIVYVGLAKRQFREALSSAGVSILMFLLAIVIFTAPQIFIKLPNQIAVAAQSIIVSSFASGIAGGEGLCATNIGAKSIEAGTGNLKDQALLDQVTQNLQSSIGCVFWQTFVFQPWVEGQWGANYEDLWAKGFAPGGGKALNNDNQEMVGDAAVPIGDGKFINNWAVFQMSTQTEAHSPLGHDGNYSKVTNNVSNDWWRIVDAVSNYNETATTQFTESSVGENKSFEYTVPDTSKEPLVYWDTWSGNNGWARIGAASSSVLIGGIGLFTPMVFAFLTAVYAIGTTLIMSFAPLALLFGAWGTRGLNIFKQWGLLFISVFMKRIGMAVMLMLSIVFTNAAINLMQNVNWWSGMVLLVVISIVLFVARSKILDALTSFGVSPGIFKSGADRIASSFQRGTINTGKVALSGAAGAVYSKRSGGTILDGIKAGSGEKIKNLTYNSNIAMSARRQYEAAKLESGETSAKDLLGDKICRICMKPLASDADVMLGSNGNYIHEACYYSDEDLVSTEFPDETFRELSMLDSSFHTNPKNRSTMFKKINEVNGNYQQSKDTFDKNISNSADPDSVIANTVIHELMPEIKDALKRYKDSNDADVVKIAVPDAIVHLLPQEVVDAAMRDGDTKAVEALFAYAFIKDLSSKLGAAIVTNLDAVQATVINSIQNPEEAPTDTRVDKTITIELAANRDARN